MVFYRSGFPSCVLKNKNVCPIPLRYLLCVLNMSIRVVVLHSACRFSVVQIFRLCLLILLHVYQSQYDWLHVLTCNYSKKCMITCEDIHYRYFPPFNHSFEKQQQLFCAQNQVELVLSINLVRSPLVNISYHFRLFVLKLLIKLLNYQSYSNLSISFTLFRFINNQVQIITLFNPCSECPIFLQ